MTKIVATLGPVSSGPDVIAEMVRAGAGVFRLNCSHLSTDGLRRMIDVIRAVAPDTAVLVDIQGPKMRYSGAEQDLVPDASVRFAHRELGLESVAKSGGLSSLAPGHRILLDDGRIETVVTGSDDRSVEVRIERGGRLRPNKGVNLPDTVIVGGVLSDKDRDDLNVAREKAVEYVAVSFVQDPSDVESVRMRLHDGQMIIAKIERPQALGRLDAICAVSDGVMAARGDLGVELPYEEIPSIQHRIGRTALERGILSVCATEMLESMISASRPTRAEVADVTAAVLDGFDAVMLSGETAVGHDPVGAVRAMGRICAAAERDVSMPNVFADANPHLAAVTAAASALAKRVQADSILAITYTGYSAKLLASCRPACTIIAATPDTSVARSLALCRGVRPIVSSRPSDVGNAIGHALAVAREQNLVSPKDTVVICLSRSSPRSDVDTVLLHTEH